MQDFDKTVFESARKKARRSERLYVCDSVTHDKTTICVYRQQQKAITLTQNALYVLQNDAKI